MTDDYQSQFKRPRPQPHTEYYAQFNQPRKEAVEAEIDYTGAQGNLFDKIGGWLVLPAFLHPVVAIYGNLQSSYDVFKLYSESLPYISQVFIFAVGVLGIIIAIAWVVSAYLAGTLSIIFPKFYIGLTIFSIASLVAVLAVSAYLFGYTPAQQDYADLTKAAFAAIVWVPYMLVSKRVKATFYGIPMPTKLQYKNMSEPLIQQRNEQETFSMEPPREKARVELNMVQRTGMVLYWTGTGIAAIFVALGIFGAFNAPDKFVVWLCFGAAAGSWLVGRALKFIFVGR